jgi:hypothetical protein
VGFWHAFTVVAVTVAAFVSILLSPNGKWVARSPGKPVFYDNENYFSKYRSNFTFFRNNLRKL